MAREVFLLLHRAVFGFQGCRTSSSLNWPDFRAALGVRAIIEDFLRDLPGRADHLTSLANAGQAQELARLAHSIQGIGLSLGLAELAGHCRAIEEAANSADAPRIAHLIQALPGLVQSGERGLREWLVAQGQGG